MRDGLSERRPSDCRRQLRERWPKRMVLDSPALVRHRGDIDVGDQTVEVDSYGSHTRPSATAESRTPTHPADLRAVRLHRGQATAMEPTPLSSLADLLDHPER